ncbi:hypothetical protein AYI69_g1284 [Smittium culicis]|uniref:Uncharacterized protein n=1 Tax=Smittium culicis TaxID=133412 RepID=A0A1R1YQP3_9FUNG|nr:hypothetical protein AYI69_g1284 [Smittium culicis]
MNRSSIAATVGDRWAEQQVHEHFSPVCAVVVLRALLLLAEIPRYMAPIIVVDRHHIKQEWVHIVVQRLVVKEALAQKAQVPAVRLLLAAVDLEKRYAVMSVYLVARRVEQRALVRPMSLHLLARRVVAQTKLAHVQQIYPNDRLAVRREVPRLDLVLAHLDRLDVLDPRNFRHMRALALRRIVATARFLRRVHGKIRVLVHPAAAAILARSALRRGANICGLGRC